MGFEVPRLIGAEEARGTLTYFARWFWSLRAFSTQVLTSRAPACPQGDTSGSFQAVKMLPAPRVFTIDFAAFPQCS